MQMLHVADELSELHFRTPLVDLRLAEKLCQESIQRKIDLLKTREHVLVYESLHLLAGILDAKGDNLEAEAYRSLTPKTSGIVYLFQNADEECSQLETLCRMDKDFAAAHVGSRVFQNHLSQ